MDLKPMVEKLLQGDLRAAAPLIDRLKECGDSRAFNLLNYLEDMREGYLIQSGKLAKRNFRSPEEQVYRTGEMRYAVWAKFAQNVHHLFYYEINGAPDLEYLKTLGEELDAPRQAIRLGENISRKQMSQIHMDEEYGSDEGMMVPEAMMGDPIRPIRSRRYAE